MRSKSLPVSPVVCQELLINELVRLRLGKGLTQEQVCARLRWSTAKMKRFEGGTQIMPLRVVNDLIDLYRVPYRIASRLRQWAEHAHTKAWWNDHTSLERGQRRYLGLEAGAETIREVSPLKLPVLVQHNAYARAVLAATLLDSEWVEEWVALGVQRRAHARLRGARVERVHLIGESALRLHIGVGAGGGGGRVMGFQLHELAEACVAPGVRVRVLPERAGELAGLVGAFALFDFPPGLGPILFTEHRERWESCEDPAVVGVYRERFDAMEAAALTVEESRELIRHYTDRIGAGGGVDRQTPPT